MRGMQGPDAAWLDRVEAVWAADDALAAFRALTLHDLGRPAEALAVALRALTPHLPRYHRSLYAYADALTPSDD